MISRKRWFIIVCLSLLCLLLHIYSLDENRVEAGYSNRFYPRLASLMRFIGSIPFSIGDILYGLAAIWLAWRLIRFLRRTFSKKYPRKKLIADFFYRALVACCVIYLVFNICWGMNYSRKGIAWQLGLDMDKYDTTDLRVMNELLKNKVNDAKTFLVENKIAYPADDALFKMVGEAYNNVSHQYSFLDYHPISIKRSMWGWIGNSSGFTGYYNPFTGEAQVNTTVPTFLHSFITCHEVAHQLGYAKEMEANSVGYLAAANSGNPVFHYSAYLDLFIYANRNLYFIDSALAGKYRRALIDPVKKDLKEWADFNRKHESWAEPVVRWLYGKYLQGNKQPKGVLSYDEVTAFIIAYYKKFGRI